MAKHLVFDFDGTLVDSAPGILHTLALVLQMHDLQPMQPLSQELIGPPLVDTLRKLVGSVDAAVLEKLASDFRTIYDLEGVKVTVLYAGIRDALAALVTRGCDLHLATNKREKPTLLLLQQLGIAKYFRSVYCLDSRSPAFANKGEMLRVQLLEQGLVPGDCLYIGDTVHDETAAALAAMPFVAVAWGYGVEGQQVSSNARQLSYPAELHTI